MSSVKVYFVLPPRYANEKCTPEDMKLAFETCVANNVSPDWIPENDLLKCSFGKKDIVVFEKFEGEIFEKIRRIETNKCLSIVGPRCLITGVTEGIAIPNNGSPIYTMAMANLKIALSNFPPVKKKHLKERIEHMGGIFCAQFYPSVQYLVSSGVKSQKYVTAINNNIKVMSEKWVEVVWDVGQTSVVNATDPEYMDKYKLPPFAQLTITSTGFNDEERKELQALIDGNGGTFTGKMNLKSTHVLVCKSSMKSNKFISASKNKIPCVRADWIYDCIKNGVALNEEPYLIKISSSTPTKLAVPYDLNFSQMSEISGSGMRQFDANMSTINSTNVSLYLPQATFNESNIKATQKTNDVRKNTQEDYENLLNNISLQEVKLAGPFLDGCGIYLAGFSSKSREKLCRILRIGGATRYDDVSDRITQVLVGDRTSHELKIFTSKGCSAPMVSINWLLESIKIKSPALEETFLVTVKGSPSATTPASPLVKKGLNLLRSNTSMVNPVKSNIVATRIDFEEDQGDSILNQYRTKNNDPEEDTLRKMLAQHNFEDTNKRNKEETKHGTRTETVKAGLPQESTYTDTDESNLPFFKDKGFVLLGLDEEDYETTVHCIEQRCGLLKSPKYTGIPDYVIVPIFINDIKVNATETYNYLWVYDCDCENEIVPAEYFHQPIFNNHSIRPLQNCVVTISNYMKSERNFLKEVLIHLGAHYQDQFSKIAAHNVKQNTHLICSSKSGKKYDAAISWGITVVTNKWVMECLKTDSHADEKHFGIDPINETEPVSHPNKTATPQKAKNYFPTEKRRFNKLDISICKRNDEQKENKSSTTPQINADSPFSGFRKTSIERSVLFSQDNRTRNEVEQFSTPVSHRTGEKEGRDLQFSKYFNDSFSKNEGGKDVCPVAGPSKTPDINVNDLTKKYDGDGFIEIDGEQVLLSKYMQEMRDQGLFEVGSPIDNDISPFVVPKYLKGEKSTPKQNLNDSVQVSQDTPVGKYIKGLQQRKVLPTESRRLCTPDSPIPKNMLDVATPSTPLGAFMGEDPTPETRKYWQKRIDRVPHYSVHDRPPVKDRRISTPLSEVKRQAWAKLLDEEYTPTRKEDTPEDQVESASKRQKLIMSISDIDDEEEPQEEERSEAEMDKDSQLTNQLKQLEKMLKSNESSGGSRGSLIRSLPERKSITHVQTSLFHMKDSQPDSVTWVDPIPPLPTENDVSLSVEPENRKFMISSVAQDLKIGYEQIIRTLGGIVIDSPNFDIQVTHVICHVPTRNEKILASMASGKYILHASYLMDSKEANKFLDEELYEIGNPKMLDRVRSEISSTTVNFRAFHWWRKKITEQKHGAFLNWRVLVFHKSKSQLQRLVEAGDGVVVNARPPFTHNIDVTHCLLETKQTDYKEFIPLAKQGIPCLNGVYLSVYLNTLGETNIKDNIIKGFEDYY